MNYVDFLEGKYVYKSTISKIITAVNNDKIDDINEKIVKIYEILNYNFGKQNQYIYYDNYPNQYL